MAISDDDRTFVNNNQGHVQKLVDLFFANARSAGDSTLSLEFALGEQGLASMQDTNGCTATELINSFKDFVDEIQS